MGAFHLGDELIDHAEGVWLYTRDGKKILDVTGGIGVLSHGHNNPRILNSRLNFQKQKRMEVHKTIFSPYVAALSHNIAKLLPDDLDYSFFCNSGAEAVVEGCDSNGCEYMTGGTAVILGETGRNFGAGMSGGIAYVFDKENKFKDKFNSELCDLKQISPGSEDDKILMKIVKKHSKETDSSLAKKMLSDWENYVLKFKKVVPRDYEKALLKLNRKHEVYIN